MRYLLKSDDEEFAEFASVEGLAGELRDIGGHQGAVLSFTDGRFFGAAADWARRGSRWPSDLDGVDVCLIGADGRGCGSLFVGPIQPVALFGADADGIVGEVIFKADFLQPIPPHGQQQWERLASQGPRLGDWHSMTTSERRGLLFANRVAFARSQQRRILPPSCSIDGRAVGDYPSVFLALGEALDGPGGYVGADLDGLRDRLLDYDHSPQGSVLVWEHMSVMTATLERADAWARENWRVDGGLAAEQVDLLAEVSAIFRERGIQVDMRG